MIRKVFIRTYGCTLNQADSDIIRAELEKRYEIVGREEDSDLVIVSTCGVKEATENKILQYLGELERRGRKTIVAGCLPAMNYGKVKRFAPNAVAFVGPNAIGRIAEIIAGYEENGKTGQKILDGEFSDKFQLESGTDETIARVQICSGCLSACTFCGTKLARGTFKSKPVELVESEVEIAAKKGAKEIQLCAQDTACYGFDLGTDLAELLEQLNALHGRFFLRVGMGSPQHYCRHLKELVKAFKLEKVYKFLHVPVQSGSNAVLKRMDRRYTAGEFKELVEEFRKRIPEITVATDIIAGFPGETEEEFCETLKLLEEVKPEIVNVSKYSAREGTPAAKMRQVPSQTVKKRTKRAARLCDKIALDKNEKWVGWEGRALFTEKGKNNSWKGRNAAYKQIVLKSGRNLLGRELQVRVVQAKPTHLLTHRKE